MYYPQNINLIKNLWVNSIFTSNHQISVSEILTNLNELIKDKIGIAENFNKYSAEYSTFPTSKSNFQQK